MTKHLFTLIWTRKRSNSLLIIEIFVSFLVLFVVISMGLNNLNRIKVPIGFDINNVYSVGFDMRRFETLWNEDFFASLNSAMRELRALDEVKSVAVFSPIPFGMAESNNHFKYEDKDYYASISYASDDADKVFGIKILEGRWFNETDDALSWRPVVVDKQFVDEYFDEGESPIGKVISDDPETRIIGVSEHFRRSGQLSRIRPFLFHRRSMEVFSKNEAFNLIIRVRENTGSDFPEKALDILYKEVGNSSINIETMDRIRNRNLKFASSPFFIVLAISLSLVFMVVLGMIGVFWQSVISRFEEIGLRRALGSSKNSVYKQFIAEIFIVTSIASLLAVIILLQLPILGLLDNTNWFVIMESIIISTLVIYSIAFFSGLYPAWLASRIEPAEALHYD